MIIDAKDEEYVIKVLEGVVLAKEDAKKRGFKKGHPGQGFVTCPKCGKNLSYSVASNGHMMAGCVTASCVRFME